MKSINFQFVAIALGFAALVSLMLFSLFLLCQILAPRVAHVLTANLYAYPEITWAVLIGCGVAHLIKFVVGD